MGRHIFWIQVPPPVQLMLPHGCQVVNDVIADKNVVTKIMSKSTGLQHIGFNSFAKHNWQTGYYPVAYGWFLGL